MTPSVTQSRTTGIPPAGGATLGIDVEVVTKDPQVKGFSVHVGTVKRTV